MSRTAASAARCGVCTHQGSWMCGLKGEHAVCLTYKEKG